MSTKQSPYNFYLLDSPNHFVFECTPFDVSSNLLIEPGFINYQDYYTAGFTDVSQVATLDISSNMINNMFLFNQSTSIEEIPFNVFNSSSIVYGIANTSYNFSFSQANTSTNTIMNDYIKAINYEIAQTDIIIFKDISFIKDGLENLDSIFNLKIKQNISYNISSNNNTVLQPANQNPYSYACKQLISGILTYSSPERITRFWDDINTQTPPYSVVFHTGDSIAVRIGYVPKNGDGSKLEGLSTTMNNRLYTRTYKIILNVK
jgi:hypothetical protein